jgi:hypothetical protein
MSAAVTTGTADEPQATEPAVISCGDSANCSLGTPAIQVVNHGVGPAIKARSAASKTGIRGVGQPGVKGSSGGGNGVEGYSESSAGVYGESNGYSGEGVHGHGTEYLTEGVLGTSIQNVGVWGISSGTEGNNIGVWGQTAGTYGFWTNQYIGTQSGCIGCTLSFVGLNANGSTLRVGDVVSVSGVDAPLEGQHTPILKVRRAKAGSTVLGIVLARAEVSTAQARVSATDSDARKALEVAGMAEGTVAPGDYLFVVVQGLVQARADAGAGIQAGDWLMAGNDGLAALATPDAQTIGQAVDAVEPASGLVWVLVDLQ